MKAKYTLKELMQNKIQLLDYPKNFNLDKEFEFIYKPNDDSWLMLYTVYYDIIQELKNNSDLVSLCELG